MRENLSGFGKHGIGACCTRHVLLFSFSLENARVIGPTVPKSGVLRNGRRLLDGTSWRLVSFLKWRGRRSFGGNIFDFGEDDSGACSTRHTEMLDQNWERDDRKTILLRFVVS